MFNGWFSSVPGPTLCNRAFAHYGTSFGHVGMEIWYANRQYKSIYERMLDEGLTSKLYDFDQASSTMEIVKWGPIGAWVRSDQGIVTATRDALGFSSLRRSVAAGLTIRAGGFPMVVASYAVGGGEGRHFSFTINTSLLGGSSRPALD